MAHVVLRQWRKAPHSPIALFPDIPAGDNLILSYEHFGQHGAADYALVLRRTTPVPKSEAHALLHELAGLGYRPKVVSRRRTR